MKCFYHNDMDGKCSAFWVSKLLDCKNYNDFIEINYNKKFPLDIISKDEAVWIVDFSIQLDDMYELLERTTQVVWIDHHKTAIEKYEGFSFDLPGIRKDGIAACVLTFMYCFPFGRVPYFTKLVGDRDIWKFEYGENTRNFHYGTMAEDTSPCSTFWVELWTDAQLITHFPEGKLQRVINNGIIIRQYRSKFSEEYMKSWSFETLIDGHSCLCVNVGGVGSDFLNEENKEKYDILSAFIFDGKNWVVSLYSDKTDVSEIVKRIGKECNAISSGGHKGAAGMVVGEFPFKRSHDGE